MNSPRPASSRFSEEDFAVSEPIENIFEALHDDPREAARLTMIADMTIVLENHIRAQGWTQKEAAKRLGVTQPRISDLLRGKISLFSIDSLVALLTAAGIKIELRFRTAA